jgi:hypothetical protein
MDKKSNKGGVLIRHQKPGVGAWLIAVMNVFSPCGTKERHFLPGHKRIPLRCHGQSQLALRVNSQRSTFDPPSGRFVKRHPESPSKDRRSYAKRNGENPERLKLAYDAAKRSPTHCPEDFHGRGARPGGNGSGGHNRPYRKPVVDVHPHPQTNPMDAIRFRRHFSQNPPIFFPSAHTSLGHLTPAGTPRARRLRPNPTPPPASEPAPNPAEREGRRISEYQRPPRWEKSTASHSSPPWVWRSARTSVPSGPPATARALASSWVDLHAI